MFRKLSSGRFIVIISLIIGILGTFSMVYAQQADIDTYRIAVDQRGNMRLLGPDINGDSGNEPKEHEFEIKLPSSGHVNKLVTDLKSILFQVADNVSALQGTVAGLEDTVSGFEGLTSDFASTIGEQEADIIALLGRIAELENTASGLESRVSELESNSGGSGGGGPSGGSGDGDPGGGDPGGGDPGGIITDGLVLWLSMDEGQGSVVVDQSGFGNDGVINGATWAQLPNGSWYLSFDGTDDMIDLGDVSALDFGTGDFSVEAWVKRDVDDTTRFIISKKDAAATNNAGWEIGDFGTPDSTGVFYRIADGDSQGSAAAGDTPNIATATWKHLMLTFDRDGSVTINIDDINEFDESIATESSSVDNAISLIVGARTSGGSQASFFKGIIGEVRVYNRLLSPLEIQQNILATEWRYR